jgi:CheY-like chemotaxis protein
MVQNAECTRVALVVENDKELRALAVALLEETDLRVMEASSGEEALRYLHDHAGKVTLIFSEVKLRCHMGGVDLARLVRLRWPWIKTVLTSDGSPCGRSRQGSKACALHAETLVAACGVDRGREGGASIPL